MLIDVGRIQKTELSKALKCIGLGTFYPLVLGAMGKSIGCYDGLPFVFVL